MPRWDGIGDCEVTRTLDASSYDTDKAEHFHYLRNYEERFKDLVDKDVRLLELGIYKGGSLLLWRDYFPKGVIVGLDLNAVQIDDPGHRIHTYGGLQQDTLLLDRIAKETAPEGFDIIIDDCSHIGELTRISFWHLFNNHLKAGGLYVIEDWCTGYWDGWVDGSGFSPRSIIPPFNRNLFRLRSGLARLQRKPLTRALANTAKKFINKRQFQSHNYGLVGFVKELVDECGMADITRPDRGRPPFRESKFKEMRISPGHIFIVKA